MCFGVCHDDKRNCDCDFEPCFSRPPGSCSINKVEVLALGMGLHEASCVGLCHIIAEDDPFCMLLDGQVGNVVVLGS